MLDEIMKAQQEKFTRWLTGSSGRSVKKILNGVKSICLEHKKAAAIPLEIGTDGESYTDGKKIHVSLMKMFLDPKYSRAFWLLVMKTSTAHECQHVNSTSLKSATAMTKRFGQYMSNKYGFNASIGEHLAFQMFNIIEDGRIENIIVHKMPGLVLNFRIKNDEIRVLNYIDEAANKGDSKKEFSHFMSQCLSYAKCGGNAIGIDKYSGHRMEHKFAIAKPYIDNAMTAYSCGECIRQTEDMLMALSDYFNELLKADSDFANFLDQLCQNMTLSGGDNECEFNQDGENNPLRIFIQKPAGGQDGKQQKGKSQSGKSNNGTPSDEDSSEKGTGSGESDGSDKNEADANSGSDHSDGNGGSDHSDGNGADESTNSDTNDNADGNTNGSKGDSSDEKGTGSDKSKGNKAEDNSVSNHSDAGNADKSANNKAADPKKKRKDSDKIKSKDNDSSEKVKLDPRPDFDFKIEAGTDMTANFDNLELQNRGYTEHELRTALQMIEAEQQASFAPIVQQPQRRVQSCKTVHKGTFSYTEHTIQGGTEKIPQDLRQKAIKLRKGLEKLIRMKKQNRINTRFGEINTRALYKLSAKEDNFFQQINRNKKPSIAFYILIDNSGSMSSADKSVAARRASAVMEEAFTEFAKVKIVLFCSAGGIQHFLVRDWEQKGKYNASINSLSQVMPSGGNKDGYSIRIATQDLLQRRERQKVLLVLSDGLPSDYHHGEDGIIDVRNAVTEASEAGITVVGIPFGDAQFIQNNMKDFQKMYSTICAADPSTLIDVFGKIFKKQILKS